MALVELVELDRADGWSLSRAARLAALADAPDAFPGASAEWADGGETRWRERLLDTTALKVVAVRDGVPAGLVRGVVEDGCARLHSLWVSPQVRGQGLGNQLVAAVEEWAARQGATYIRLEVVPDNAPAIALYRRHGYVDTGVLGGAPGRRSRAGHGEVMPSGRSDRSHPAQLPAHQLPSLPVTARECQAA